MALVEDALTATTACSKRNRSPGGGVALAARSEAIEKADQSPSTVKAMSVTGVQIIRRVLEEPVPHDRKESGFDGRDHRGASSKIHRPGHDGCSNAAEDQMEDLVQAGRVIDPPKW
jgi:chaperonin GroEL (HSP60 family)